MAQEPLKAVILTALRVEYQSVRAFLSNCREEEHPVSNTIYERGQFAANGRTWEVGIVEIGAGNVDAGIETNRAIEYFKPQVVFFVGIAGGIKDAAIGDVVAATKIYGYESGKAEAKEFKTRVGVAESSYGLVQRARAEARKPDWLQRLSDRPDPTPNVWVEPIAAGEKVVASTKSPTYKLLEGNFSDAIAVEMEGYGFSRAVYAGTSASSMVIRGISDLIDGKNDANKYGPEPDRQKKASEHASAFAFQILAKYDPNPRVTEPILPKVEARFWNELFSVFHEADLAFLKTALEQVLIGADRDYPLGQIDTLPALQTALVKLDDRDLAVIWVGYLIQKSQEDANFRISSELQTWYDAKRTPEPKPPPPKSPGYLLISLDPKNDAGTVEFMAELHKPDGTVQTDLVPSGTKCSLEEPDEALSRLLSETIRKAERIKTIEIFLSWQHLHKPIHEWKANAGLLIEPLKNFRGTLIRSLDRVTLAFAQEWYERLEEQLTCLRRCKGTDLANRCYDVMTLNGVDLSNDLDDAEPGYLILKLLTVLPEDQKELLQFMNALLRSGIPLCFWTYRAPTDISALSKTINELLTVENLSEEAVLAEVVRKKRKQLPDLGLLFECHTRIPRLPTIDELSRLRQPVA